MTTFDVGDMHPNTPHLLADLVELLCIINYTGEYISSDRLSKFAECIKYQCR
jgi:hypothetical protein